MYVAGIDGCRGGWVAFKVELSSNATSVEVVDVTAMLTSRPDDLVCVAIDIPIGLLDGPRACDKAARKLLGQPRGTSVFAAPCRASLSADDHAGATAANLRATGKGLSKQAWEIVPKIKQVDSVITADCQKWAFEVHPEVCFWALAGGRPMTHRKKSAAGRNERLDLLRSLFPEIERYLVNRTLGVGVDDLMDAAVAAWTALRLYKGEAQRVREPERDSKGLSVVIWY